MAEPDPGRACPRGRPGVRYGDTLGLQRELLEQVPSPILERLAPLPGTWQPLSALRRKGHYP